MLSVKLCGPAHGKDSVELVPDWSKADMAKLRERLSRVNWGEEGQDLGAEAEWERFKEILDREVVMCVLVKRRRKGSKPWWMTRKVMRMIRKKRRMWKFYTSDQRCKHDYNQFLGCKNIQKEVKVAVKNAKRNYERKLAKDSKVNPKAFWSYMKKKTGNRVSVGPLKGDSNKLVTDSKEQADILNSWYCSVFTREDTSNIPKPMDVVEGRVKQEEVEITEKEVESSETKVCTWP